MVSEKDFLRAMGVDESQNFMTLVASCLRSKGCVALPIKKQTAGDLMSAPAVTVRPETPVREVAELFAARAYQPGPGDGCGRAPGGDRQPGRPGPGHALDEVPAHERGLFQQNDGPDPEPAPGERRGGLLVLAGELPGDWPWWPTSTTAFWKTPTWCLSSARSGLRRCSSMAPSKAPWPSPATSSAGISFRPCIGVTAWQLLFFAPWLAAALAVSVSIAVMHLTKTLHPPGGATALIAVIGGPKIHQLGYFYALMPVAAGALIMLAVALIVNNLAPTRRYPEYWF